MKLTVIRISNLDIDSHFDGVCEYIAMAVEQALCLSSSSDGWLSEAGYPAVMRERGRGERRENM